MIRGGHDKESKQNEHKNRTEFLMLGINAVLLISISGQRQDL